MSAAHKCEGPGYHPEAHAEHQTQHRDSACQAEALQTAERKRFEGLRAKLCCAGWELYKTEGGPYFIVRWGKSRCVQSLDDAADFARQVGVSL